MLFGLLNLPGVFVTMSGEVLFGHLLLIPMGITDQIYLSIMPTVLIVNIFLGGTVWYFIRKVQKRI